jgi:hypothetical protein
VNVKKKFNFLHTTFSQWYVITLFSRTFTSTRSSNRKKIFQFLEKKIMQTLNFFSSFCDFFLTQQAPLGKVYYVVQSIYDWKIINFAPFDRYLLEEKEKNRIYGFSHHCILDFVNLTRRRKEKRTTVFFLFFVMFHLHHSVVSSSNGITISRACIYTNNWNLEKKKEEKRKEMRLLQTFLHPAWSV